MAKTTEKNWRFEKHPGTDVEVFIQWKGTTVCMDLHCTCGAHNHFDTDFIYSVQCGQCGAVFDVGTQVQVRRVDEPQGEPRVGRIS